MSRLKRLFVLLVVVLAVITFDQATKSIAQRSLAGEPAREYLGGAVRLEYAENVGSFLSLGATLPAETRFWIFTVFSSLLVLGLAVYALRASEQTPLLVYLGIALVIAGGVGNLIDRLTHGGRVVDFMQLRAGPLRTGVFNVADVALMVGIGLVLLALLRGDHEAEPRNREEAQSR
jgi:signal peptidase II